MLSQVQTQGVHIHTWHTKKVYNGFMDVFTKHNFISLKLVFY